MTERYTEDNHVPLKPHSPTEDTPTPQEKEEWWDPHAADHSLKKPKQDNQQLREEIRKLMESFAKDAVDASKTARGFAYGNQIDRMVALFQKEQLQLVSELLSEMPKKALSGKPMDRAYNRGIDQAAWNIERKKQELERLQ